MAHIRPQITVDSALRDAESGVSDQDNAVKHGVAVKTIRRWKRDYRDLGKQRGQTHLGALCPVCDDGVLDSRAYAELLGWYLGDGHISPQRSGVFGLHIVNDSQYVQDIDHLCNLMRAVKPRSRPHRRNRPGCVIVTTSWKHWPCLFPQHGPGRKHERHIVLADWQRHVVEQHPAAFLRGLFHSDGSRVRNWATQQVGGATKRYEYPRWQFSNVSDDILALCCWALDLVEISWRRSRWNHVSVSRREAVERLDGLIGLKG